MDSLTDLSSARAWRFVAAGFGTGYVPLAAGTVASACAALTGAGLLVVSPWLLALCALLASVGGFVAIKRAAVRGDPGWVVIDEFAGQWITLLALPRPSVPGLIAAFVLFRLFDVTSWDRSDGRTVSTGHSASWPTMSLPASSRRCF